MMREEINLWWKQAEADLDTAKVNLNGKRYYAVVLFCQQSLEKALKALWLKKIKKEFPKIHDLTFFMKKLKVPKEFENICKDLTTAYTETRYPSDITPLKRFSEKETKEILERTKNFIKWLKKKI